MSISPVDMQVMITKTTEVASKHSSELHKAVADQQKVSENEKLRQEENTKKVHDRNTTEKIYVDEEDKEKNKNSQGNDKNKSNNNEEEIEEEKEQSPKSYIVGGHFDASI